MSRSHAGGASAALSDDVRRALTETSVDVHFSPTYSPDAWRAALTRAAARPRLLAQLWPQAGAEDLAALDYQDARVMEIAEDLARWCARYSEAITRGWDAARARDALLLWLSPTEVPRARREGAVAALLVDRAVSRATRYAALRLRSALDMQAEVDDG
jgi:hypothetical protein